MTIEKAFLLELAEACEAAKENDAEFSRCLEQYDLYVTPGDVIDLLTQNDVLTKSVQVMHEDRARTVDSMAKLMIELDQLNGRLAKLSIDSQARKDQRRDRQAQGIEKAKAAGAYKGRPVDEDLHKRVKELLKAGLGIRAAARYANCSPTTVLRVKEGLLKGISQ